MDVTDATYNRYGSWLSVWCAALLSLFFLTGCATEAYQRATAEYSMNYNQQLELIRQFNVAQQQQPNLIELELYPDGRIKKLALGRELKMPQLPVYNPPVDRTAEITGGVLRTAIKAGAAVWGLDIIAGGLVDLAEAGGGNTSYGDVSGSFNSAGRDYNGMSAGRDIGTGTINNLPINSSFNDNRRWWNSGDGESPNIGPGDGGASNNTSPPNYPPEAPAE